MLKITMFQLLFSFLTCLNVTSAYKVLVFFPFVAKSHGILGEGYVRTLLDDGHQVTYVTPFPLKYHENLTNIDLSDNLALISWDMLKFDLLIKKATNPDNMGSFVTHISRITINNKNLQAFLRDPKVEFDVVIVEWMYSELFSGLGALFNAPLIWSASTDPHWMTLLLIDGSSNPAYTPDNNSPNSPPFISICQRLEQLYYMAVGFYNKRPINSHDAELYESHLRPIALSRGRTLPTLEEARYSGALMLGNSHVSLGSATTLPQSFKPIGGYHIDPEVKPLPEDLQKVMDNAKSGVIYMSMGSNLKSKELPEPIKQDLLEMFGQLQQTVIWKFEEELPGTPDNVHIVKWAPQAAILNHTNCVLFITHGGLLSTTEAVHYGVPIVGMPVFSDQPLNVQRAVNKGFAKRVIWSNDVKVELKAAIEEILTDSSYSARVQYISRVYHERPAAPRVPATCRTQCASSARGAAGRSWYTRDMYCTRAEYLEALHELLCWSEVFECYCYSGQLGT